MDVNYRFMVRTILDLPLGARTLDYGCGAGDVVQAARERGADVHGVDVFYEGAESKRIVEGRGLLGSIILPMEHGRIPFPNHTFDLIVSNQVFEHVEDMDAALSELARVLKPGGHMMHNFPSLEVLREGHIGIPLAHKFPKNRFRYAYTYLCRAIGMGHFKNNQTVAEWTRAKLDWIDRFTVYRSRRDIYAHLKRHGFQWRHEELRYITFRLSNPALRRLATVLRPLSERVFQRLAFMVLRVSSEPESLAQVAD